MNSTGTPVFVVGVNASISTTFSIPRTGNGTTENEPYQLWISELGSHDVNLSFIFADGLVSILAFAGNVLVVVSFVRERSLLKPHNYHVLSLAIADALVGGIAVPLFLWSYVTGKPDDYMGCMWVSQWTLLCTVVSIFGLLVVTIDRYLAVVRPGIYMGLQSPKTSLLSIGFAWTAGTFIGLLPAMGWNQGPSPTGTCVVILIYPQLYTTVVSITTILLPLIAMAIVYVIIFTTLQKQAALLNPNNIAGLTPCTVQRITRRRRRNYRRALSFAAVVGAFVVCWLPLFVINMVHVIDGRGSIPLYVAHVALVFSHTNSLINPVIYAAGLPDVREVLLGMMRMKMVANAAGPPPGSQAVLWSCSPAVVVTPAGGGRGEAREGMGGAEESAVSLGLGTGLRDRGSNSRTENATMSTLEVPTYRKVDLASSYLEEKLLRGNTNLPVLFWDDLDQDAREIRESVATEDDEAFPSTSTLEEDTHPSTIAARHA